MEKRAHLRVPSSIRFRYQVVEMPLANPIREAELLDLSAGGAAFYADGLAVGDVLKVEIYIPDYHKSIAEKPVLGRPITTLAKVVRKWDHLGRLGVGVNFLGTYSRDEKDIMDYTVRKSFLLKRRQKISL